MQVEVAAEFGAALPGQVALGVVAMALLQWQSLQRQQPVALGLLILAAALAAEALARLTRLILVMEGLAAPASSFFATQSLFRP
jgi:chromate transport protein ChrA